VARELESAIDKNTSQRQRKMLEEVTEKKERNK
jgi:hypothetical protein